jgi:Head domain of trimeric autotransporter adhesin
MKKILFLLINLLAIGFCYSASNVFIDNNMTPRIFVGEATGSAPSGDYVLKTGDIMSGNLTAPNLISLNGITASTATFNSIKLSTDTVIPTYQEGTLYWDNTEHTLAIQMGLSDTTMQVGSEQYLRVRNNTGSIIQNGSLVYINGRLGNRPTVALALATSSTTAKVCGMATEDIAISADGFITTNGVVRGLDTSLYLANTTLYLSTTTPGAYTDIFPEMPNYAITIGHINTSANNGSIAIDLSIDTTNNVIVNKLGVINDLNVHDGNFIVKGSDLIDNPITETGAGSRMFFSPYKFAFRAGYAEGNEWDYANIGLGSIAMGSGTTASSNSTIALGAGASATASDAMAFGNVSTANAPSSIAFGNHVTASGTSAIAMGDTTLAMGDISTTFGVNTTAQSYASLVAGRYNTITGSTDTWIATDPLFVLGNGESAGSPSNALSVFKNGNTTINGTLNTTYGIATSTATFSDLIVATGTVSSGSALTTSGTGTRMIWYPRKAAFRAGNVSSTEWDDANIGLYSAAFGTGSKATGAGAMAFGAGAEATGNQSFATSFGTRATASFSTAMGNLTQATGSAATALGNNTVASGSYSTAMGNSTTAEAFSTLVAGQYNLLLGGNSSSWIATDPLFMIGNGTAPSAPSNALTILKNGTVITYDTIIATGTHGSGTTLTTSGVGTRMIWYPKKSAFRAGFVSDIQWDDSYIGSYSFAAGYNTRASAAFSTAFGSTTTASGASSFAAGGAGTTASNQLAIALGNGATASGYSSVAIGELATASGQSSISIGRNSNANGVYATAMGVSTIATGQGSFTCGYGTRAPTNYSTAMGFGGVASGEGSTAMGYNTVSSGTYSTAMGFNTKAQAYGSLVIGKWNIVSGTQTSWVDTEPVFAIGNGADTNNRANVITILKNGKMGFNITTPTTTIHLNGTFSDTASTTQILYSTDTISANSSYIVIASSGGIVALSSNPQISTTNIVDGTEIDIWGSSDTNTITLLDGNGIKLNSNVAFTLGLDDMIRFKYRAVSGYWCEKFRSDN